MGNVNNQWNDDQLKQQINDVYNQELGRDADPDGAAGFLEQARRGLNVDTDIRNSIRGSDEYKQRQSQQNQPPAATTPPPAATPPPGTNSTNAPPPSNMGPQTRAYQATQMASNPQLDQLMQQMIASEKAAQARADADAQSRTDFNNKVRTGIMTQYDKASQPVDANDPTLSALRQQHDAAGQRARAQGQEAMAARGATEGTPTGANDAQVQSSFENLGKDNAAYGANLDYTELNNRRTLIGQLLGQGSGILNADESNMLQSKMGTMDASLKALGLKSGAYLQGAGLDNQNNQFYDNMSNNNAMQQALMNQYFMQMLAGGGN